MKVKAAVVSIPVLDLPEARRWYERVLDRRFDIEPMPGIAEAELREGFSLMLSEGQGPRDSLMTVVLEVEDVHTERARLETLGVSTAEVQEVPGVVAWSDFTDPYGNRLSLVQALG